MVNVIRDDFIFGAYTLLIALLELNLSKDDFINHLCGFGCLWNYVINCTWRNRLMFSHDRRKRELLAKNGTARYWEHFSQKMHVANWRKVLLEFFWPIKQNLKKIREMALFLHCFAIGKIQRLSLIL